MLNRFQRGRGTCRADLHQWGLSPSESCSCGQKQTMSHIVDSCPLSRFEGSLQQLHTADDRAVHWLETAAKKSTREMKTDDRNSNTNLMKHNFLRSQKLRKWPVLIKLIKTEKWPPSDTLHAQWIIIAVRLGPAYPTYNRISTSRRYGRTLISSMWQRSYI